MVTQELYDALSQVIIYTAIIFVVVALIFKLLTQSRGMRDLIKRRVANKKMIAFSAIKFILWSLISLFFIRLIFEYLKLITIKSDLTNSSINKMDKILEANQGFEDMFATTFAISIVATSIFVSLLFMMILKPLSRLALDVFSYFRSYKKNEKTYERLRSYNLDFVHKGLDDAISLKENKNHFIFDSYTLNHIQKSIVIYGSKENEHQNKKLITKLSKLYQLEEAHQFTTSGALKAVGYRKGVEHNDE